MKAVVSSKRGFTLIELVIVLVLIGILAAIAVPRFGNLQLEAKKAAVKGILNEVRSGIRIFNAEKQVQQALGTTVSLWPTIAEITDGTVVDGDFPQNPLKYSGGSLAPSSAVIAASQAQANARSVVTGTEGWAYFQGTGNTASIFYANDSTEGINDF